MPDTTMTKLAQSIERCRTQLAVAELFALKYDSKLPDGLGSLWTGSFGTRFDISLRGRSQSDRDKALSLLGEVFGRGGWEAKISFNHDYFDWSQRIDGVEIKIEGAQPTGQPKSFPVDPKQFPLQLEDNR